MKQRNYSDGSNHNILRYKVLNQHIELSNVIDFCFDIILLHSLTAFEIWLDHFISFNKLNLIRVVNIYQATILQKSHIWPHLPIATTSSKNH